MKSHIDWNELVPRLPPGLQQTLYLEAVKMVTNGGALDDMAERKRAYARAWWRANKKRYSRKYKKIGRQRKWTDEKIAKVRDYYKAHGHTPTLEHYGISSSMLSKWGIKATR